MTKYWEKNKVKYCLSWVFFFLNKIHIDEYLPNQNMDGQQAGK